MRGNPTWQNKSFQRAVPSNRPMWKTSSKDASKDVRRDKGTMSRDSNSLVITLPASVSTAQTTLQ
jgi:hypothetical protein